MLRTGQDRIWYKYIKAPGFSILLDDKKVRQMFKQVYNKTIRDNKFISKLVHFLDNPLFSTPGNEHTCKCFGTQKFIALDGIQKCFLIKAICTRTDFSFEGCVFGGRFCVGDGRRCVCAAGVLRSDFCSAAAPVSGLERRQWSMSFSFAAAKGCWWWLLQSYSRVGARADLSGALMDGHIKVTRGMGAQASVNHFYYPAIFIFIFHICIFPDYSSSSGGGSGHNTLWGGGRQGGRV